MIVLTILKIIGLVLAGILALALLLVLLVLLVPIRYKIKGKGIDSDITASAKAKWMLGFVSACVSYAEKSVSICVKVAGIKIKTIEFGSETIKKDQPQPAVENDSELQKQINEEIDYSFELNDKEEKLNSKQEKINITEKLREKLLAIVEKIKSLYAKFKTIWEKIKTGKYIFDAPVTKRAIAYAKTQIFKLLKHLKPRRMSGHIGIGMGDPEKTAKIYGIAGIAGAAIDRHLVIVPYFEEKKIDIDAVIKGRIIAGYMLILFLGILFNKDITRVRKYIRRNF